MKFLLLSLLEPLRQFDLAPMATFWIELDQQRHGAIYAAMIDRGWHKSAKI